MRTLLLAAAAGAAYACSNIIVSKGASSDGAPHVAYAADDEDLFGHLRYFEGRNFTPGTTMKVWDWDSGKYLGEIEQPTVRYNVVGNMNEHGLAIGETTFGGLQSLATQPGAKMDYGTLIWYTLGVARTCREAIQKMAELTDKYGYFSTGETFSLIDTHEAWVMDFIGKGPGQKGAVWVARKIPDGQITAHANQARIRTWDQTDRANNMWAPDVIEFARSKGLWRGSDKDFSFSDVYDPVTFSGARLGEARAYSVLSKLSTEAGFAARYLDYAQGYNLTNRMPLFVTPKHKVAVNDTMWLMRTHFDGTWFDESKDVGAGAFHARVRARPLTWKFQGNTYLNERTIGVQQTGWNFVAHSRGSYMSAEVAPVIWFAVDDTSTGPHFPAYATARAVPASWTKAQASATKFSLQSAHWVYNMVANFAYSMWEPVFPWVQAKIVEVEADFHQQLAESDAYVVQLLKRGQREEAVRAMTVFTVQTGDGLVQRWLEFYGETFARFHDFSIIRAKAPADPRDREVPEVQGIGFDDAWKARIVREAGGKYRFPKEPSEQELHKLKCIQ